MRHPGGSWTEGSALGGQRHQLGGPLRGQTKKAQKGVAATSTWARGSGSAARPGVAIANQNLWNRLNVATRQVAGKWKPGAAAGEWQPGA